jgi:hypothetical protein
MPRLLSVSYTCTHSRKITLPLLPSSATTTHDQDFGDWTDQLREAYASPEHLPFTSLLSTRDDYARMRLARCLVQLARLASRLCPSSSAYAHMELCARLQRMVAKEAGGRTVLLQVSWKEGQ